MSEEIIESKEMVVDKRSGEILAESTPEDLLVAASDAAKALERMIQLNERPPLMFNGRRYLEIHHWQALAKFYHCTVATSEPEFIELDGIKGFKAKATVVDERTGIVTGGAEAFCMRDEPNWAKRPLYTLASMAQTRAASKSLSNKFRFVAIVAGYEGTPSEEMQDVTPARSVVMPKAKAVSETAGTPLVGRGVDHLDRGEQRDRPVDGGGKSKFFEVLHKVVREKEVPEELIKSMMAQMFHKEHSRDLTDAETIKLIKAVETMP